MSTGPFDGLSARCGALALATLSSLIAVIVATIIPASAAVQPDGTTPDGATTTTSMLPPQTAAPSADLRLGGSVEEAPPAQGIGTGDTLGHRFTIQNQGPDAVPVGGLLLTLSVGRVDVGGLATMEVARFNDGGRLQPAQGGACGIGTRQVIQCTNRQALDPGQEISLVVAHRHPTPEAGSLSLSAQVSIVSAAVSDPVGGNNGYGGPTYRFAVQPATSTTLEATTTTLDPSSTSSSEPGASTSSETTIAPSTTTTLAPTTTTLPTTTSPLESMTDDSASLVASQATMLQSAADGSPQVDGDQELVLAPTADEPGDGGGPPLLLLGALGALVLVAGGVALALYIHLNQAPPLVDIRRFD